jgi:hypothetical protein
MLVNLELFDKVMSLGLVGGGIDKNHGFAISFVDEFPIADVQVSLHFGYNPFSKSTFTCG